MLRYSNTQSVGMTMLLCTNTILKANDFFAGIFNLCSFNILLHFWVYLVLFKQFLLIKYFG